MSSFAGVAGIGNSKPYQGDAFAALGLGFANFANSIIIRHPCVVLRRQCQVHDNAWRKHLGPISLIPVIIRLTKKDGFLSLWKGANGSGVLCAFSRVSELVIAELFGLPKSFIHDGSSERFWRYVWLKASNYVFCTPVIVSSFIETVRSGAGLAEELYVLEVITRGFERLSQDLFGGHAAATADRRRHSIFWLALPTSVYQTCHFLICRYVYAQTYTWTRAYVSRKMPSDRKRYHTIMPDLFSTMTCVFVADLVCYPLETVLHRLYIQGTRILVDNLDSGTSALMPAGRYTGFFDCIRSIFQKEGFWTLFSGVGAVFLQYALQHCLAGLVYWALDRNTSGYTSGPLRIKPPTPFQPDPLMYDSFRGGGAAHPQNPIVAAHQATPSRDHQQAPMMVDDGQQATSSSLGAAPFPSFAQTQQKNFETENNPFFAALRHSSDSTFGPMDNNSTIISDSNSHAPSGRGDFRHH